jgi:asparagine synthase (glutamine-hydrolysing)
VTVALNGDGGDESFAGYERYAAMSLAEKYHRLPRFVRESLIEKSVSLVPTSELRRSRARDLKRFLQVASLPKTERYLRWVSAFDRVTKDELYDSKFARQFLNHNPADFLETWFKHANGSGVVDATMMTDQMTYLPNDLLVKVDIASMAVSLEARSPFLDHKVIEFAASLPENIKLRGTETKSLLKRVAAKLVPSEVIYRRKMGFGVPITHWFRGELKNFVRENLLSEKSLNRGLFNGQTVTRLVNEHAAGERDHASKLWTLLMLELWFQKFID